MWSKPHTWTLVLGVRNFANELGHPAPWFLKAETSRETDQTTVRCWSSNLVFGLEPKGPCFFFPLSRLWWDNHCMCWWTYVYSEIMWNLCFPQSIPSFWNKLVVCVDELSSIALSSHQVMVSLTLFGCALLFQHVPTMLSQPSKWPGMLCWWLLKT